MMAYVGVISILAGFYVLILLSETATSRSTSSSDGLQEIDNEIRDLIQEHLDAADDNTEGGVHHERKEVKNDETWVNERYTDGVEAVRQLNDDTVDDEEELIRSLLSRMMDSKKRAQEKGLSATHQTKFWGTGTSFRCPVCGKFVRRVRPLYKGR